MKKITLNIVSVALTVVLFFVVLEASVRVFHLWNLPNYEAVNWFRPSEIPGVPYLLKPNLNQEWGQGTVITNAEGLRANRTFPERHPDKFRILALGDSVTFGFGVDQSDTIPAQLEFLINDGSKKDRLAEVVNAGINGLSLYDEANYLPGLVDRYKPDAIIWTLVPNDYDDSLGVTDKGVLGWEANDYVLNSAHEFSLGQDASKAADFKDFRNSMNPTALNWAAGIRLKQNTVESFLQKNSYAYNWLAWMLKDVLIRNSKSDPEPKVNRARQEYWKASDGKVHPFPAHVALYSYQTRINDFNNKLAAVRKFTESKQIPLIIVNTALPILESNMINSSLYSYIDSSVLIDEPFFEFHQRHNLRWDPHFSPEGNNIFARGLKKALVCYGVIKGSEICEDIKSKQAAYSGYWKKFFVSQDEYASQFLPFIDFKNYTGFPQIAGGIFPPGEFPGGPSQRAEFILARPINADSVFHLRMLTHPSDVLNLRLTFTLGSSVVHREGVINSSNSGLDFDLSDLFEKNPSPKLLEFSLSCPTKTCAPAKLVFLGFGKIDQLNRKTSTSTSPDFDLKVTNWGPQSAKAGTNPNVQPDGSMGIWIQAANTNGFGEAQVFFGEQPSKTTSVQDKLITGAISMEQLGHPGSKEVTIKQLSTGKIYTVGKFVIESEK